VASVSFLPRFAVFFGVTGSSILLTLDAFLVLLGFSSDAVCTGEAELSFFLAKKAI
jgi:hypothetical protein